MGLVTPMAVACPACGHRFNQQVHQSVDAEKEPALKQALIQERLNSGTCPQCRNQVVLNSPVLYHDAGRSLLALYIPLGMGRTDAEQQQLVGSLTNRFMSSLEPEERRGYMLQPRMFLTLQSLAEDILMGDGLTKEQIEARRERTALLERLLSSTTMEDLQSSIEANMEQFDEAFFDVLDSWIEQAEQGGDSESHAALSALRQELQAAVNPEEAAANQAELEEARRELLDVLLNERDEDRLRSLVASARPMLDYYFFLQVADRIEQAEKDGNEIEARRVTKARATILEIVDELEEEERKALTEAVEHLRAALSQTNPEEFLRQDPSRLNDAFFAVLSMNMAEAGRRNDENTARAMSAVGAIAAKIMEENAPPPVRLLNQLLRAEPEERHAMLEQNAELVNDEFVQTVKQMQQVLGPNNEEVSERLAAVAELVGEFVERNGQGG
ncbi:MAG: hypothetical protein GXX93_01555 [Anaerolineae bacterium]|nr:hypothetical protein [Anaerolineae bacterium]